MTDRDTLSRNGIRANAAELVAAAEKVGVPLWIAAAFVEQESGGLNVYGHDAGGTFSGAGAVTQSNYATFLAKVRSGARSNGVGPLQITYPGYFRQTTEEIANLWRPYDNLVFGLRIIKSFLAGRTDDAALNAAAQRYNSGSPTGAPSYGRAVVERAHRWRSLLTATTPQQPVASLQQGSSGTRVSALQSGLNRVFPSYSQLKVDGQFGPATAAVVREFQKRVGLEQDGIVGPSTLTYLARYGVKA